MIENFFASWPLFQHAYLTGWLIGLLLSLLGVIVVARDQIFLGVAIAQSSTLGIAVAMRLGDVLAGLGFAWLQSDSFLSCMAVLFALLAAVLTAPRGGPGHESHEARTGWVFLSTASFAILLVTHSPHGLAEVQRLVSSSLIGATAADVWVLGGGVLATVLGLGCMQRRLLLFTLDPAMAMPTAMAMAVGMRVRLWTIGVTLWLGLAVGLSIRVAGVLYVFGCLILPPLAARNVCHAVKPMFLVAPLIAMTAGIIGSVLADYYDYPPAQVTVALLCLFLVVAGGYAVGVRSTQHRVAIFVKNFY
jgi:ABC-type Mn2+/Zn2+ transport system permease subunit